MPNALHRNSEPNPLYEQKFLESVMMPGMRADPAQDPVIGAFAQGIGNQAVGLYQMGKHPIETGKAIGSAIMHPVETAKAMYQQFIDSFQSPEKFAQYAGEWVNPLRPLGALRKAGGPMHEMTVYHGTPHEFDAFDMGKIGTGEGAQAYGHGLYFAQSKDVAGSYRRAGKGFADFDSVTYDGIDYPRGTNRAYTLRDVAKEGRASVLQRMEKAAEGYELNDYAPDQARLIREEMEFVKKVNPDKVRLNGGGNLYHVDIPDEAVAKMLDWDAPLSDQSPELRRLVSRVAPELEAKARQAKINEMELIANNDSALYKIFEPGGALSGVMKRFSNGTQTLNDEARINRAFKEYADVYEAPDFLSGLEAQRGVSVGDALEKMGIGHPETGRGISEQIHALGIPGIKYFDQGSRAGGEGTRNIVLFDDKLAKIIGRE